MTDASSLSAVTDAAVSDAGAGALSALSLKMKSGTDTAKITKTAENFESLFASQLLQPMFDTVQVDQSFGGGHGEEVMRSFLLQEYGKIIAKGDKLGIASQVKAEMLRAQEGGKDGKATAGQAQSAYAANASTSVLTTGATNVSVQ